LRKIARDSGHRGLQEEGIVLDEVYESGEQGDDKRGVLDRFQDETEQLYPLARSITGDLQKVA